MYYGAGTYEAFARPEKPIGVDKKSAYIIGTGLAGLSAAFYLVRDGQMKGENIHLLEKLDLAGGSCDGRRDVTKGFYMRGGREMDNHFECMWDMFRSVPSIETPEVSVLDEYYWLNKHDPNYSLCRATINCGEDAHTDKLFKLDKKSALALSKLFITKEEDLENKKISDVLPDSFWETNFWLYWQTMFAFQKWSSALEMKRYLCRYVHHILTENDLVFITNGCCTDTSCYGDQNTIPDLSKVKNGEGESWNLWKNIASQATNGEFGNPDKFCNNTDETNWMSATVEVSDEEIIKHIINICKRDPREGKVTTGGIVTVKDSMENWYLSWTINRQPQFKSQKKNSVLVWVYALNTNREGNFVKKPIRNCTGREICEEWLYHIGIPTDKIEEYANKCNTTTCYMPYINAFFQPREEKDRPLVVPKDAVNFAFIGQFAETPRDTIFTTEYSIRTGMEAVYTLLKVDRAVPEVWGSKYDVRELLKACFYAVDKKSVDELPLTFAEKQAIKILEKKVKGTDLELLLKESGLFKE